MGTRIGVVTGRRTGQNRGVGPLVRLLQVQLTDETDVQTVQLVEQVGEESSPPDGSLVSVTSSGEAFKVSTGTDDGVTPILDIGGKRIYSTDPATAEVIAEVRLDPDGKITVSNPGATVTIDPSGVVTVDALTVHMTGDLIVDGTITAPNVKGTTDVEFGGKSAITHEHSGVQTGVGQTGPPV